MKIVDLQRGELFALSGDYDRIQVLFGRVWLTEAGRLDDVFAASGETIQPVCRGRALIEALGFARIAVATRREAARRSRWGWLQRPLLRRTRRPLESSPALA